MNNTDTESRTTSGQRALMAAALQGCADVDADTALHLADVCAVLLDGGWTDPLRAVLAHLLDHASAARICAALTEGDPVPSIQLVNGQRTHRQVIEPADLPAWATFGSWSEPGGTGRRLFGRELLDLRTIAGPASPHFRVLALAAEQGRPTVAVQVSDSGTPVLLGRADARHVLLAIVRAIKVTWRHRSGQR
jgi:hypothetical protein